MFDLYYVDHGVDLYQGRFKNTKEMWIYINNYLNSINFKYYYIRGWCTEDGQNWIDFGSHRNFFYYVEVDWSDEN